MEESASSGLKDISTQELSNELEIILDIVLEDLQNWHFDAHTFLHLICLIPNENTFNDLDSYWKQFINVGEISRIIDQLIRRDLI
jgi:hypothetical protein